MKRPDITDDKYKATINEALRESPAVLCDYMDDQDKYIDYLEQKITELIKET